MGLVKLQKLLTTLELNRALPQPLNCPLALVLGIIERTHLLR